MSYTFAFQKILDLKGKEKEQLQTTLSASLKKLEEEKSVNEQLKKVQEDTESTLIKIQAQPIRISELLQINEYMEHLDSLIDNSNQRLNRAESEVDKRIHQVTEKAKEEESWNRLKNKEYLNYRYEMNRKEQIDLDEIATSRYIRGNKNF